MSDLNANTITATSSVTGSTATFSNANPAASLQVTQVGTAPASTSTGGAVNIDNSLSSGAGLVVFSSNAAPTGRLIVGRSSSATFSQTVGFFQQAGTGHALHADLTQTASATASALNVTSANVSNSAVFISGVETGRGTVKITHTGTGTDASAAALSMDLAGSGTAAQGIFIDATGGGTTGDLMDLRNNGNQLFKVGSESGTIARPRITLGNGGPIITYHTTSPEGVIAAPPGSLCLSTAGGANTTAYVKRSGTGNTGWVFITA